LNDTLLRSCGVSTKTVAATANIRTTKAQKDELAMAGERVGRAKVAHRTHSPFRRSPWHCWSA
jgi:hypothetical protein